MNIVYSYVSAFFNTVVSSSGRYLELRVLPTIWFNVKSIFIIDVHTSPNLSRVTLIQY